MDKIVLFAFLSAKVDFELVSLWGLSNESQTIIFAKLNPSLGKKLEKLR